MPTNIRNLFMVVILSCIAWSHGNAAPRSSEDRRFDIELFLAETFHSDNIPEDLVEALLAAEKAVGRKLAGHELFLFADRYFEAVYESPVETPTETPPRKNCFTCTMRVLTPRGYMMIGSLKVGDEVYSVDEASRTLVVNRIAAVIVGENQGFGRVTSRAALLPIEATESHPFYLPDKGYYRSIGKIDEGTNLLGVRMSRGIEALERSSVTGAAPHGGTLRPTETRLPDGGSDGGGGSSVTGGGGNNGGNSGGNSGGGGSNGGSNGGLASSIDARQSADSKAGMSISVVPSGGSSPTVGIMGSQSDVLPTPPTCEMVLAPLLMYQKAVGRGTVFNLTLEKDPHNYIIEGVLVHNVKGGI